MHSVSRNTDHWQFALGCAVKQIDAWVREFDFHASLSGHAAYVGITPDGLITTIDGFLSERWSVPGGTVTDLEGLLKSLADTIAPAYEEVCA